MACFKDAIEFSGNLLALKAPRWATTSLSAKFNFPLLLSLQDTQITSIKIELIFS